MASPSDHDRGSTPILDQLLALSDREIYQGRWERPELRRVVDNPERHLYTALEGDDEIEFTEITRQATLEESRTVLGFVVVSVCGWDGVDAELAGRADEVYDPSDCPLGLFQSLVVAPSARNRHVGTRLAMVAVGEALVPDDRVDEVMGVAWIRDGAEPNTRLVGKYADVVHEFTDITDVDRDCPECGMDGTCECTFWVYAADC